MISILPLALIFLLTACKNDLELPYIHEVKINVLVDDTLFEKTESIIEILVESPSSNSICVENDSTIVLAQEFPIIGDTQFIRDFFITFRDSENMSAVHNAIIANGGTLTLKNWRIESFEFLDDLWYIEEFSNVNSLNFVNIYVPQGVRIQPSDALEVLISINLENIHGSGSADVVYDILPLPNIRELSLSGNIPSENPLPYTPSLIDLYIVTPDAIEIIQNNTHISGILHLGRIKFPLTWTSSWGGGGHDDIKSLYGIETFTQLRALTVPRYVRDLSPLTGLESLRIVDLIYSEHIYSLAPLQGIPNLQEILICKDLYDVLSEYDRHIFTPTNNRYYDRVHVHFANIGHSFDISPTIVGSEWTSDTILVIEGETIESFAFLRYHPEIRYLRIYDSEILSFDYLADYTTNLVAMSFGENIVADGLIIPRIETLMNLTVSGSESVIQLIQLNSHLPGRLSIRLGDFQISPCYELPCSVLSFEYLKNFNYLQELAITTWWHTVDLSALSNMRNLHTLSLDVIMIESFSPLFELSRLRQVFIERGLLLSIRRCEALMQEEQKFNRNWYLARFIY